MKKISFFFIILLLTALLLTACAVSSLSQEEKERYLEEALEERGIENVDEELTAVLMAEKEVRYAYVAEQDDVIEVHITFVAGTDSGTVNDLSKKANEMAKEKYPDRTISVKGSIDVD